MIFLKEKSHEHSTYIHFNLALPRVKTYPLHQGQESRSSVQSPIIIIISTLSFHLSGSVALRVEEKVLKTLTELSD